MEASEKIERRFAFTVLLGVTVVGCILVASPWLAPKDESEQDVSVCRLEEYEITLPREAFVPGPRVLGCHPDEGLLMFQVYRVGEGDNLSFNHTGFTEADYLWKRVDVSIRTGKHSKGRTEISKKNNYTIFGNAKDKVSDISGNATLFEQIIKEEFMQDRRVFYYLSKSANIHRLFCRKDGDLDGFACGAGQYSPQDGLGVSYTYRNPTSEPNLHISEEMEAVLDSIIAKVD